MEAARRWGFDPSQPAVRPLLRARALQEQEENGVIVEIVKEFDYLGERCEPGRLWKMPRRLADYLIQRGFAKPFVKPS